MSDLYGKVLARFWTDPEIRALSERQQIILLYLLSNEHRTITGVYRLPLAYIAYELKLRGDDVDAAIFHHLTAWVKYDPSTEEIWVRNLAAVNLDQAHSQPFAPPKPGKTKEDSRLPALRRSLAGIRSAWLRSEWLHYYAAWAPALGMAAPAERVDAPALTIIRRVDAPSDAPSHPPSTPPGGGIDTPSTPIAVAGSSSTSSSSTVPNGTGEPLAEEPLTVRQQAGLLMPLVRAHLYAPDGEPPPGYDDGRDFGILCTLLEGGLSASTLEAGIAGVAMMRDAGEFERWKPVPIRRGGKMTMRVLYNTRHGVVQMLEEAAARYWKAGDQGKGKRGAPTSVAAIMGGLAHGR